MTGMDDPASADTAKTYMAPNSSDKRTPSTMDHYSTHKAAAVAAGVKDHSAHFGVLSSDSKVSSPLPKPQMTKEIGGSAIAPEKIDSKGAYLKSSLGTVFGRSQ